MAGRSALVLVADDDMFQRTVLATVLEDAGFQTVSAASVREAISCADAREFGAAIMDLHLPNETDGRKLADGLTRRRVPIVVYSGLKEEQVRAHLPGVAVSAVIEKPYDPGRVISALMQALCIDSAMR